jgi:hypothetical protein
LQAGKVILKTGGKCKELNNRSREIGIRILKKKQE